MSFGLTRGKQVDLGRHGLTLADLPQYREDDPSSYVVDPRSWFEEPHHPFELEIGSGKGTFLVQQAVRHPRTNYLGIEYAREFFVYAADRIRRHALNNVRMLHADASEFIRYRLPGGIVSVIHLYFSDPWPKSRHHKRRVIQDASLEAFARVLVPHGEIHLVTDHPDLHAWHEEHAARHSETFDRHPFDPPVSAGDGEVVGTNFERKYRREGRPFHAMTLRKR